MKDVSLPTLQVIPARMAFGGIAWMFGVRKG